jgi:hypothetical protein
MSKALKNKTKLNDMVSVKDFGAVGDGATDDATSINNALATKKPVEFISATGYKTTQPLTSSGEAGILGAGFLSAIYPTGLSASQDALGVSPPADGNSREFSFLDGVYILQNAGGRHAVQVDLSASIQRMSRYSVKNCYLRANGSSNYALKINNPTNAPDRFFSSTFENNVFAGGLSLLGVGDSININGNTFTGVNEAIAVTQTTNISSGGAGDSSMFVFQNNNSTANKGIYIVDAQAPKIRDNNLECGSGPGAGTEQALINLLGATARIKHAEVTGNILYHAPNCTTGVYIGQTESAVIENNTFGIAATGYAIVVSANARNTIIGYNLYSPTGTGREILDNGVGTKGVLKAPTLQNSWVNYGSGHEDAGFIKGRDSYVTLSGVIKDGTITSNTLLYTLPVGFRPAGRTYFTVHALSGGGVFLNGVVRVDTDGSVYLRSIPSGHASVVELSLTGIRFYAPDVV